MLFTIQLKYATGEAKQSVVLGVDAGYNRMGLSVVSEDKELMRGVVNLRNLEVVFLDNLG